MLHYLLARDAHPAPTGAKVALVTVVMGDPYERSWERICRPSWQAYADRLGFDIIVIKDRLDPEDTRSPAWQKLLILDQAWSRRYQRIVWVDSDIVISPGAPDIVKYSGPPEKVSLCLEGGRLSDAELQIYVERLNNITVFPETLATARALTQRFMYANSEVPEHDLSYNTGVLVLSPEHHNTIFLHCYQQRQVNFLNEQPYLSHFLVETDMGFAISPRFNWGFIESLNIYFRSGLRGDEDESFLTRSILLLARAELRNSYFMHFYAAMDYLDQFASHPELTLAFTALAA